MHIPEDSLSMLIEGSRRDDSGHIRSRHLDSVIPAAGGFRVGSDTRNVHEGYFEAALERPKLVRASHVQSQFALGYRYIHHFCPLETSNLSERVAHRKRS